LLIALVTVAVSYVVFELGVYVQGTWLIVGASMLTVAEVMLPASVFVLIRRQPSWRVDLAISRTLVGILLTVTLVIAYVVAVWALSMIAPWGAESTGMVVVAALALAVLPLKDFLQRQVERVAQALEAGDADTPQLAGLVDALRRALRLARVEVSVHGEVVASAGRRERDGLGRDLTVELHQRGRSIGVLAAHGATAAPDLGPGHRGRPARRGQPCGRGGAVAGRRGTPRGAAPTSAGAARRDRSCALRHGPGPGRGPRDVQPES
jgi:hypothetical protein